MGSGKWKDGGGLHLDVSMSDPVLTSTYDADQRQDSCSPRRIEQQPRSRQSHHRSTKGGVDIFIGFSALCGPTVCTP